MKSNLGIFIQARMGSTRLPGKIFMDINRKPSLKILTDNLKQTKYKNNIFILTSDKRKDDIVEKFAKSENIQYFRGSEKDVLDRFFQAALKFNIDDIVRLTGDCPFLSMKILSKSIDNYYQNNKPDYLLVENYPRGLGDIEISTFKTLKKIHSDSKDNYHREHVMTYIIDNPKKFKIVIKKAKQKYNRPDIRLTLDEQKDLDLLRIVYQKLNGKISTDNIINLFTNEPSLLEINKEVKQKTK